MLVYPSSLRIYMANVGRSIFRLPFTGRALPIEVSVGRSSTVFSSPSIFSRSARGSTDRIDGRWPRSRRRDPRHRPGRVKLQDEFVYWTPLVYFALSITAGMLGFFVWNRHPAKVFMGDTGSLALGAGLSLMCLYLGMPWVFLLVGFIYCLEAVSVILQVGYFKATGGTRIFKMTPIHHHFELSGWSEWKIDGVFALMTVVLSIAAYFIV